MIEEGRPADVLSRVSIFLQRAYAPGIHIAYAIAIFAAIDSLTHLFNPLSTGKPWLISRESVLLISILFLLLMAIRAADELKDYDYDRIYNPERLLITGALTKGDMWQILALSGGGAFLFSLNFGAFVSYWTLGVVAYTVLLIGVERVSQRVQDDIFLNMLVTFPVNLMCNSLIFFAHISRTNTPFDGLELAKVLVIPATAFLQFEFAKKTGWAHHLVAGQRFYSTRIGVLGAVLLIFILAVSGPALLLSWFPPEWGDWQQWLPVGFLTLIPLFFLALGSLKLMAVRKKEKVSKAAVMAPLAMVAMAMILIGIVFYVVVKNGLQWL